MLGILWLEGKLQLCCRFSQRWGKWSIFLPLILNAMYTVDVDITFGLISLLLLHSKFTYACCQYHSILCCSLQFFPVLLSTSGRRYCAAFNRIWRLYFILFFQFWTFWWVLECCERSLSSGIILVFEYHEYNLNFGTMPGAGASNNKSGTSAVFLLIANRFVYLWLMIFI